MPIFHNYSSWASDEPQTNEHTSVRGDAGLGGTYGERTGGDRVHDSLYRKEAERGASRIGTSGCTQSRHDSVQV